ncbi:hypothetical protein HNP33_002089 [Comamonas odontotermitis]|uniref:SRPBCC domain-containing protein n=1 Tax=Comamonas odontotermitis TaxID=379895 RepID=A0ABR6RFT0_9BURK|nr:SRPBCC domain-containing protein [Comamonas odontotermitis]MBB6578021.1 hypothetical protein [Comamonas odontotermitis]
MKHNLVTSISISASPERVWEILMDFARYPEWNPFICSLEGASSEGQVLEVKIQPEGGRAMTFRPTVLRNTPTGEFRWLGKLLIKGLFDGEHYFKLEPIAGGGTRFTQGEQFSGVLVSLFRDSLDKGTKAGFEAMNLAMKKRAEAVSS